MTSNTLSALQAEPAGQHESDSMTSVMNLYLIARNDEVGYDEYDAHVVAAETEDAARSMVQWNAVPDTPPTVELVGIAAVGTKAGAILSSFRAG